MAEKGRLGSKIAMMQLVAKFWLMQQEIFDGIQKLYWIVFYDQNLQWLNYW